LLVTQNHYRGDMYNKIFTKILDSSIWMESVHTRIVWVTFLAAMDEDGFVGFACPANVAHRANLPLPETLAALECLEGPDANSSDPDNGGRRLERVPGGWMVLNAVKYRDLVTRLAIKERNRNRVRKFREKKRNACVTRVKRKRNATVMQSDTDTDTDSRCLTPPSPSSSDSGDYPAATAAAQASPSSLERKIETAFHKFRAANKAKIQEAFAAKDLLSLVSAFGGNPKHPEWGAVCDGMPWAAIPSIMGWSIELGAALRAPSGFIKMRRAWLDLSPSERNRIGREQCALYGIPLAEGGAA
jgi:hypothetical protein